MDKIEFSNNNNALRLFTYKVAHDGGNAPNPYHGVCTLAICKPRIRNTAQINDIVVGLAPGTSGRIVYCMQITDTMPWSEYIKLCEGGSEHNSKQEYREIRKKIPRGKKDQGDCIWKMVDSSHEPRSSHSDHGKDDFERDVGGNKHVLLSNKFWYFGEGKNADSGFDLKILENMPIPNRGHISNKNYEYREKFIEYFNALLVTNGIYNFGVYGNPDSPPNSDPSRCARCRIDERESDQEGEEQ